MLYELVYINTSFTSKYIYWDGLYVGMINRAKKRIMDEGIANAGLFRGDIATIGLKDDIFDKIICMSVMQYLSDKDCESALREIVRIGKDGAIIVMHIKNFSSIYLSTLYLAKKIKKIFTKNIQTDYYRSYIWYANTYASGAITLRYSIALLVIQGCPP